MARPGAVREEYPIMSRSIVDCIDRDHERLNEIIGRLGSASRGRESLGN